MFTSAQANVPDRMKQGVDYVLISYYEEDCNDLKPDWNAVFQKLALMFPKARLGFGKVGTSKAADKAPTCSATTRSSPRWPTTRVAISGGMSSRTWCRRPNRSGRR